MPDVRCPMCGKLNPADAQVCRHCQARLTPLGEPTAHPPAEQPPAANPPAGDNSTDWLHGLLGSEEPHEPAAPSEDQEQTDWLSRIRQRTQNEQDELSKIGTPPEINETPAKPDDSSDWLRGLTNNPAASSANADDVSAWLDSLGDNEPAPAAPAEVPPAASAEPPAPAEELSDEDWLRNLTASGFSSGFGEPEAGAAPGPAAAELPETPAAPAEIPDWLGNMGQTPPAAPEPTLPAADETPDWLSNRSGAAPAEPAPADDISNWLQSLDATGQPPAQAETPAAPTAAEELPDWLQSLQTTAEPTAREEAPAAPPASEELSDWLQNIPPAPVPAARETASETPAPAGDLPDWLQSLQSSTQPANEEAPTPAEEVPDWMSSSPSSALPVETIPLGEQDQPSEPSQPPPVPAEWLSQFEAPAPEVPAEPAEPAFQAGEIPDWLTSFQQQAPAQPVSPLQEPPVVSPQTQQPYSPFSGDSLPEWLDSETIQPEKNVQPFVEEEPTAETTPPFASADINEMLAGVASDQIAADEKAGGSESDSLAPAQLPNWLQAMRPIESAMANSAVPSADDDQRLEKSGPLAGLRGVLPGEELASQYRKPPIYTNKLRLSDKQRLHTGLLEAILADESKSTPLAAEPARAHTLTLRLLVAVILILLVIVPPLAGFQLPVPASLAAGQPALTAAYNSINGLAAGSSVLVVSDFEAGLVGEMKAAAEPVLRHLQSRQSKIVLASTIPMGPMLGEQLLTESGSSALANLGYIAGGSSALKLFGTLAGPENPAPLEGAAPFPYTKDWNDPVLRAIRDISAFQRIILVTDSVETARGWIEQVQPSLPAKTQLLIVCSAQAAPLVRAYVESGQARGLVAGLSGGLAYEQLARQPGAVSSSWTAYQLSLATALLLITLGGLIAGISALFRLTKTKRKA